MKVLHVITSLDAGGAEGVLTRLCEADKSNDHHVVSLMDEGVYGEVLLKAGVGVSCLRMPKGGLSAKGLFKLWRIIRNTQPNVIQTWMYHADFLGGLVGRLAGVRNIVWGIRNTELEPGKSSRSAILVAKLCARLSSRIPARIAVCAEKAAIVHENLGYCREKMVLVPNGYDLSRFRPVSESGSALRRELGIPDSSFLMGMVARFDPFKDHETLFTALDLLAAEGVDFQCLLVGTGMTSENTELNEALMKRSLSQRIVLVGRRSDIPEVMSALDLHVLSSSSEAFPNVLAEAMACGTPCVSTDVGDAALIVGDTGWIVPPGSPEQLANALRSAVLEYRLVEDWQNRKREARKRIEQRFSLEGMVANFNSLWSDILR
ncbi:glycosyltransferase family 4 protein [Marinobacter nauticus]|uniref:glycosyltransferase family 4 protein n=1 Tax=Marinobacter nauticus TaxID=2743 RepID=UPI001C99E7D8|nr:glycosyltransferase [Marinobacter nauticus]MBY5961357.1 glycosyltransferase [Marinobacter nauticus]